MREQQIKEVFLHAGEAILPYQEDDVEDDDLEEKLNMNDYAEIMFLTKYLGDYNISKFGDKTITLEHANKMLVVERI